MPEETELKLGCRAEEVEKLGAMARGQLCEGAAKRERLVSIYFDAPTFKLQRSGVSLRIRRIGARRVQTIKALRAGASDLRRE